MSTKSEATVKLLIQKLLFNNFYKNEHFHIFIGKITFHAFFKQSLSLHWIHSVLGHPNTTRMQQFHIRE